MSRGKELDKKKEPAAPTCSSKKEVREMPDGYTPYGYLGKVDGRQIEVVSEEELYELLEDE